MCACVRVCVGCVFRFANALADVLNVGRGARCEQRGSAVVGTAIKSTTQLVCFNEEQATATIATKEAEEAAAANAAPRTTGAAAAAAAAAGPTALITITLLSATVSRTAAKEKLGRYHAELVLHLCE